MVTRRFQSWKIAIFCTIFIFLFNSVSPVFASTQTDNILLSEEIVADSHNIDKGAVEDGFTFGQTIGSAELPKANAPDFAEQLERQSQVEVELEYPKLEMKASPRLLLAGVPVQVNWSLSGMAQYDSKSSLSVYFDISKELILSEKIESAVQVDSKIEEVTRYVMAFDPKTTQGTMTLSYDEKAANAMMDSSLPWHVTVTVMDGENLVATNTVLLDFGQYEISDEKGGTITAQNGRLTVDIPAKAITEDLVMEVRDPEPAANPGYNMSGFPLEILAVGTKSMQDVTTFSDNITVTFRYDEERIYGWPEADLQIFYYDEAIHDWLPVETLVDTDSNTLTAHVNHLTVFDYAAASWQGYRLPSLDATQVSGYIGAGSYSVSLWTPPGPGGMQPSLSLSYNSQVIDDSTAFNQASWVGMGWSLDTGFVERDMHGTNSDLTDDTYRLNINGVSSLLLPIAVNGEITTFATEDQNYMQIFKKTPTGDTKDDSTWTVYDKEGNIYLFDTRAKTHTTTSCVASATNLNLTWRWSLHSVTNRCGEVISYTYIHKQKTESDNCQNVVAAYPQYILYPNSQYRVEFILQNRTDYQSSWTDDTAKRLFQRQRLDKIHIQKATSPTTWANIRTYDLSYSIGTTNQIYPNFVWTAGGRTATLAGIQEKNGGETVNQPATSFTYTDKMHLTKVDNGQGGSVTLTYEPWYILDDYNDALRSLYTPFGTTGYDCSSGVGTAWTLYGSQGTVKCEQSMLQIDGRGGVAVGVRAFPAHILKPGGRYWMFVNARAISGITDMLYGFIDAANGDDVELTLDDIGTTLTDYQNGLNMAATYDPVDSQLLIECNDCYIKKLQYMLMPGWYRVTTRVVTDVVTGQTATYTYQYDDPAVNDHDNSAWVPSSVNGDISKLYTPPMREYRGNALTRVINPDNLVTTTWYYQNDTLKGRAYRTLVSSNDYYQPFSVLSTVQSTWTLSGVGTQNLLADLKVGGVTLKTVNSSANWNATANRNGNELTQGNVVYLKFRLDSTVPDTQAQLGLENTAGDFFGVVAMPSGSDHVLKLRTRTGGGSETDGDILLTIPSVDRNEWYWLMFSLDSSSFTVQSWQEDDPQNVRGAASAERNGTAAWHYIHKVNNGILYVDAYHEGLPFSMATSAYTSTVLYDTVVDGDYPDVASNNLVTKFDDLQVVWNYLSEQTAWNYNGDATFTSTKTTYEYNTADQGGNYASTQFGNLTRVTESAWNGSAYIPYRATRTQYWPTIPTIASNVISGLYLSQPARQITLDCTSGSCDFTGETGKQAETLYLYDNSQVYDTAPSAGILSGQRTWVSGDDYSQTSYGYDSYGNVTSTTSYTAFTTSIATPAEGSQTTTTTYDSTYHTYAVSTQNALGHVTAMEYDTDIGQPTSVTDPNGAVTTAEYDDFGRQTKIVAPGDTSDLPTLTIEYVNYASASAPFHINLKQRVNASASIRISHFYDGLGREVQTQSVGKMVNGTQQNVVADKQYDSLGRLSKQTVPYTSTFDPNNPTPVFISQTFTQAYSSNTYDILGRVETATAPNGNETGYAYADLSVSVTDPKNNTTVTTSDIWGRTILVEAPSGPDLAYTYDVMDHLLTTTKGSGTSATTVSIAYNRAGQKTAMDDPDLGAWSYTYDALGNLLTQTDARGCVTGMTYDAINRLTAKNYSGGICDLFSGQGDTFTYDDTANGNYGIGRRTGMTYYYGSTAWKYDLRGRMVSEVKTIDAENLTTTWEYNSADLVTKQIYPAGEVILHTYNASGDLTHVANSDGNVFLNNSLYDEAGRITRLDYGWSSGSDILKKAFSYYAWTTTGMGGLLSGIETTKTAGGTCLQDLAYQYDDNGNITQIFNDVADETSAFTYDVLDRLTAMTVNDGQQNVHTEVFNYNGETGSMSSKGLDQQNLTSFVYGDTAHKHAISEFGSNDYYYDANGSQTHRLLEDGSWYIRLHYNPNNQMHYVQFITTPQASPTIMGMMLEIESPTATPTLTETPTGTPIAVQSETPAPTETAVPTETLLPTDTPSATDIPPELETPTETGIPEATATPAPQEIRVEETQPATAETPTTAAQPTEAPTEEPTALPTSTETPAPAETGTEIFVELPGMIPTMTETPAAMETTTPSDLPPEPEFTKELLDHLIQRPAEDNGEMMLMSTLAGVYEVSYYYDANGSMVESIVRAQVDNLMSIQWTVYIGNYFERQANYVIDTTTNQVLSREFIYRKYFYAGGTRIAMRLYRGGTTTLYWLLSDHLGSQSITANADGSLNSEVRYSAFGETRYTTATETPTDYLYTGQRIEEEAGLYYYHARFYDPVLGHFTQADTQLPHIASSLSYDRYAYVNFNPIRYSDPTGHMDDPCPGCGYDGPGSPPPPGTTPGCIPPAPNIPTPSTPAPITVVPTTLITPSAFGTYFPYYATSPSSLTLSDKIKRGELLSLIDLLIPSHLGGRVQIELSIDVGIGVSGTLGVNLVYNRNSNELASNVDWAAEAGAGIGIGVSGTGGLLIGWGSSNLDDVTQGYSGILSGTAAAEGAVSAAISFPIDNDGLHIDPYSGVIPTTIYLGIGGGGGYASIGGGINGPTGIYTNFTPFLLQYWNK